MSSSHERILNKSLSTAPSTTEQSVEAVGMALQHSMLSIKGKYLAENGKDVDYSKVGSSQEFPEYCEVANSLCNVDLSTCTEDERKAFFINVYNALTIHGLVSCDTLPSSVLEVEGFWSNTKYNIGGHIFSLDDIEHGVLRCNYPHPATGRVMFGEGDPRLKFVMSKLDPRIHFALVCGAKSCPAIQVYSVSKLERGLTSAAVSFCEQEVKVDVHHKKVTLSKIFMWYFKDFASTPSELLQWISQFLSEDNKEGMLQLLSFDSKDITIQYSDYNWLLNKL